MSSPPNPYSPSFVAQPLPGKVKIRPIQLLLRSYEMIRGDYWQLLAITVVGIVIATMVPFQILLGPMMVGIFLCFIERQQTGRTEFGTLMKGFEQFLDAFLATLIMIGLSLVIMIPVIVMFFVVFLWALGPTLAAGQNPGNPPPPPSPLAMTALVASYPLMIAASMAVYIPFMFVFQLIADHRLTAGAAVLTSVRAAWDNLGGIIWFLVVFTVISFLAALPCFIPAILLTPIFLGSLWLLYQDVFGDRPVPESDLAQG